MNSRPSPPFTWDSMGLFVSAVCLAHCLALPLLALALPAATTVLDPELHHRFHWLMLAFAVPTSLVAYAAGARRHGRWRWLAIGSSGLAVMALAVAWSEAAETPRETALTLSGALIVAFAHVMNWRDMRRHQRLAMP